MFKKGKRLLVISMAGMLAFQGSVPVQAEEYVPELVKENEQTDDSETHNENVDEKQTVQEESSETQKEVTKDTTEKTEETSKAQEGEDEKSSDEKEVVTEVTKENKSKSVKSAMTEIKAEAGDYSFEMTDLEVADRWGTKDSVDEDGNYTVAFDGQYPQIFYKLPNGLDPRRIEKVSIETDASQFSVKLCQVANEHKELAVVYGATTISKSALKTGEDLSDVELIGLMGLLTDKDSHIEKTIGKITFTLSEEIKDEPVEEAPSEQAVKPISVNKETGEYTYNVKDLINLAKWGTKLEVNKDDSVTVDFEKQYSQIFFALPDDIDGDRIQKVSVGVDSKDGFSIKLCANNGDYKQAAVTYGNDTLAVKEYEIDAADVKVLGLMNTVAGEMTKKISTVTFTMAKKELAAGTYKFNAADLEIYSVYSAETELENDGLHISYDKQYGQVYFVIPEDIPVARLTGVKVDTASADCAVKVMGTNDDSTIAKVQYGTNAISLDGDEEHLKDAHVISVMNMNTGAASRVVKSISFVVGDKAATTEGNGIKGDLTADCFKTKGNVNPIVTQRYSADPGVLVYKDTVYVYSTNDIYEYKNNSLLENSYSKIKTINCFSSTDLVNWTDHGAIPVAGKNGGEGPATWANNSWAPCAAYKNINGKDKFFLYFADNGSGIGVLTSDSPTGPWVDPLGKQLISRQTPNCGNVEWLFDPAVMVDDDGTGYLVFGGGVPSGKAAHPMTARIVQLADDMISIVGEPKTIDAPYLFEDSGINKIGDKYVYSYCSNWNCAEGFRSGTIQYMISDNPMGPYQHVGEIFANPSSFFNDGNGNNHHSLFEFKGKYYIAYHARALEKLAVGKPLGYRTTQIDEFTLTNGKINTITGTMKGVKQVASLNPYETQSATTIYRQKGVEVFGSGSPVLTVTDGDFTSVMGADFSKGSSAIEMTVNAEKDMTIDVRVGSETGTKIGTINVTATNGAFKTYKAEVANVTGTADLYFIYNGDAEVKSWKTEANIVETVIDGKDIKLSHRWNGNAIDNKISFPKQYEEYVYSLEEPIATADIQSVVVKVKDQENVICVKMFNEAGEEAFTDYGVNGSEEYSFAPAFDGKLTKISFMSMASEANAYPYGVTIDKIIITSAGKASTNVGEEVIEFTGDDLNFFEHWSDDAKSVGNKLTFNKRWDEYALELDRELDMERCKSITVKVADQGNSISFKVYRKANENDEEDKDQELQPFYDKKGSKTYTITPSCDGMAYRFAVMAQAEENAGVYPYGVTIESVKFVMDTTEREQVEKGVEYDIIDLRDAVAQTMGDDFLIGTAASYDEFRDSTEMELVYKHFNALTLGNELKPDAMLRNSEIQTVTLNGKEFEFPTLNFDTPESRLDLILDWNEKHPDKKIKVRGHVLVWHSQTPSWFFREGFTSSGAHVSKEIMNLRLEYYIKSVCEHFTAPDSKYKDLFYGWDVVNEAVSDGRGTYRNASENSEWWAVYNSNEFIKNAFVYANKYMASNIELYYNDYNDTMAGKVSGIEQLLRDVKKTPGARIDGMGMQAHYDVNSPSIDAFNDAARRYAAIVDSVQVTELDFKGATSATDEKLAKRYADIYNAIRRLREDGVNFTAMTIWGVTDKHSWLQSQNSAGGGSTTNARQYPLLFDGNYKAKNSFWAIVNAGELMPEIKTVTVARAVDNTFSAGKNHTFKMDDRQVTFVPEYKVEDNKFAVKVVVPDTTKDDADQVILYLYDGEKTIKVPVARKDATVDSTKGYEVTASATVDVEAIKSNQVKFDLVVTDNEKSYAFNDTRLKQDASTKYFAATVYKSSEVVGKGTVTIDGDGSDAAWENATEIYLAINNGAKAQAKAKLLWDEDNLYVLTTVTDAKLDNTASQAHEQDSVELFIDEDNAKTSSYKEDDKQYRINYKNEQSFNGTKCVAENIKSAVKVTEDGYVVEAALKWTDIEAKNGVSVGFDAQVNDAEAGARLGTLIWADETGNGWSSPQGLGTIILVDTAEENNGLELVAEDNGKSYITKDGKKLMNTGLECVDGKYYYVSLLGSVVTNKFDQKVSKVGESVEDTARFKDGYYWFTEDGSMYVNEGLERVDRDGKKSYILNDGRILKDTGLECIEGCYYYVTASGELKKNAFGFKPTKFGESIENPARFNGSNYFFDGNCVMIIPGETYVYTDAKGTKYILKDGKPIKNTGLEYVNGNYYYVTLFGQLETSATVKIAKVGKSVKNPADFKGKTFEFDQNGKMILASN